MKKWEIAKWIKRKHFFVSENADKKWDFLGEASVQVWVTF